MYKMQCNTYKHTFIKSQRADLRRDVSEHAFTIYSAGRKNVDSAQRRLHNCQKKKENNLTKYIHRTATHTYSPTQTHTHTHRKTYILVRAKVRCSF